MECQDEFLDGHLRRYWQGIPEFGISHTGLYVGQGTFGCEVVVFQSINILKHFDIKEIWKSRVNSRPVPVLIVVLYPDSVSICGLERQKPKVHEELEMKQVEELCNTMLNLPNRHRVYDYLSNALPTIETPVPRICN